MKLNPRVSAEGVLLARRGERLRALAEHDGQGWVVGYGHRAGAREGARVTEDDATALLVYDLSRTADAIAPLLAREPPPPLFDVLNAHAWRIGADAFARSDLLRRWNAGEALTPADVAAVREGERAPPAVLAAAAAVSDRVSQVLDTPPEPPPPRPAREPWREPPVAVAAPERERVAELPHDAHGEEPGRPDVAAPVGDRDDVTPAHEDEPPPPPLLGAHELADAPREGERPPPVHAPAPPPAPDARVLAADAADLKDEPLNLRSPAGAPAGAASPSPMVAFERGGRARLWERARSDPRVYMAVGACGAALFLCALIGLAAERPTAIGIAMGLVGVICLAPAVAFFVNRRTPGG